MNNILKEQLEAKKLLLLEEVQDIDRILGEMANPQLVKKFSPEWLKLTLSQKIAQYFNGETAHIKLVIFKTTNEYNDETYDYSPILILIDTNFQEIEQNIHIWDLVPSEEDQRRAWNEDAEGEVTVSDLTFEWND
jgi:hypothetical protein